MVTVCEGKALHLRVSVKYFVETLREVCHTLPLEDVMFSTFICFFIGIFNVVVRDGKEFHWICPSAILFCIILIGSLTVLRLQELDYLQCLRDPDSGAGNGTDCTEKYLAEPVGGIRPLLIFTPIIFTRWDGSDDDQGLGSYRGQISYIEQLSMAALILGRWFLPKGSINRDQFLQIVLIYIGTAADILELSEIFDDNLADKVYTHFL